MTTVLAVLVGILIPLLVILGTIYAIVLMFAAIGGAIDGSYGCYANPFPRILAFAYNATFKMTSKKPGWEQINRDKYYAKNR